MNTKSQVKEIIARLKILSDSGMTEQEIMEVIKKMDLPFNIHLFITGNFSKLIDSGIEGYKFRIKHGIN